MGKWTQKFQVKNWKTYTLEFLSIFIAVTSAFALNNWNENRRDRNAESKILQEISNGLEKDLEDIRINRLGHEWGIKASNYFKGILVGDSIASDSILYHYFNLTRDFVSIQNTSGYETLKSKGLELIENDSIRTKIISLYEYNYSTLRKLEEEYYELQFQENYFKEINHLLVNDLIVDENKRIVGIKVPLSIDENEEKLLITYLWKIYANRSFMLSMYADVEGKIEELRVDIQTELKN